MSDLIELIEGGIKREVSVGCAISSAICSVCGADWFKEPCQHRGGKEYDGISCWKTLKNPTDAYEISFVAVPAQPRAGVTKTHEIQDDTEKKPKEDFTGLIKLAESFIFYKKRKRETTLNKKMKSILADIEAKTVAARAAQDAGDMDTVKALLAEIDEAKADYATEERLFELEKSAVKVPAASEQKKADGFRLSQSF